MKENWRSEGCLDCPATRLSTTAHNLAVSDCIIKVIIIKIATLMSNENLFSDNKGIPPIRPIRLMIESISLENFKSYYGLLEIGPLHKCFTAVVGPNGSGKSNLIESLLFVFGKKANKMRSKNITELIHNSSLHPKVEKATVRVRFQDIYDDEKSNEYKPVPYS